METYKNILVVIDGKNFVTKAISRAVNLIKQTHGRISILLLEDNSAIHRFTNLINGNNKYTAEVSFKNKSVQLRSIIKKLAKKGIDIAPELLTCTSYNSILSETNNKHIDTVIVAASSHDSGIGYLHYSIDFFLIGKCSTPLLIVKDHDWEPGGHILSAVELFNENPEHQMLTKKVLEESEHFTQLLDVDCYTVDCYFGESMDISFNFEPCEKNQDIHLSEMKQHCHDYHLPYENVHLSLELPEDAISHIAAEIDSELVILGDCGHRGFFSKLSAHVSEEVLNKVNCDLLILKP